MPDWQRVVGKAAKEVENFAKEKADIVLMHWRDKMGIAQKEVRRGERLTARFSPPIQGLHSGLVAIVVMPSFWLCWLLLLLLALSGIAGCTASIAVCWTGPVTFVPVSMASISITQQLCHGGDTLGTSGF